MGRPVSEHAWGRPVALRELARGPLTLTLSPDAATREKLARELGLEGLPAFTAQVRLRPWLDGAELSGRIQAQVIQLCSVSLDPVEQPLTADFELKVVPPGSPNASQEVEGGELTLDLDAPDPPEVLEGEEIDVTGYVVEHFALEIDPFPRKPGAQFDFTPPPEEDSPFSVLKQLKDKKD